jgi:hypothetical protein
VTVARARPALLPISSRAGAIVPRPLLVFEQDGPDVVDGDVDSVGDSGDAEDSLQSDK